MGWYDDQRTDWGDNRIHAGWSKTYAEHNRYKVKQERTTDANDDRRQISVVGEAALLGDISDNPGDHDRAKKC